MHYLHQPRMSTRPERPVRRRADPQCTTCLGTGHFTPLGKTMSVTLRCPRCLGGAQAL